MLPTGNLRPSTAPCNGFGLLRGTEGQDERWPKSTRLADDSGGAELLSGLPEGGGRARSCSPLELKGAPTVVTLAGVEG